VYALVLLYVGELFERLVAVAARVLPHVAVDERVLAELLRRRERLEAQHALVALLVRTVALLGVTLHVRLVLELLSPNNAQRCQPAIVNVHYRVTASVRVSVSVRVRIRVVPSVL